MARDGNNTERMVAEYLGCTPDAAGSRRDWKSRHDLSVVGNDGRRWFIEVKSHKWRSGPKTLWTLLDEAWLQLCEACIAYAQDTGEETSARVVVYWPTSCRRDGSALAYLQREGSMVVMPLREFRDRFLTVEEVED